MAGEARIPRVRNRRDVHANLRAARNIAARSYKPGSVPRNAILGGFWDLGRIVQQHIEGTDDD